MPSLALCSGGWLLAREPWEQDRFPCRPGSRWGERSDPGETTLHVHAGFPLSRGGQSDRRQDRETLLCIEEGIWSVCGEGHGVR